MKTFPKYLRPTNRPNSNNFITAIRNYQLPLLRPSQNYHAPRSVTRYSRMFIISRRNVSNPQATDWPTVVDDVSRSNLVLAENVFRKRITESDGRTDGREFVSDAPKFREKKTGKKRPYLFVIGHQWPPSEIRCTNR